MNISKENRTNEEHNYFNALYVLQINEVENKILAEDEMLQLEIVGAASSYSFWISCTSTTTTT